MVGLTTAKTRDLEKIVFVGWSSPAEILQQGARPSITSSGDQRYPGHIWAIGNENRTARRSHCGGRFGLLRGRLNRSADRLRSGKEMMDGQPDIFALLIEPSLSWRNTKLAEKLRPIIVIPCFDNLAVHNAERASAPHVNPFSRRLQPVTLAGVRPPSRPHHVDRVAVYGYLICRHHQIRSGGPPPFSFGHGLVQAFSPVAEMDLAIPVVDLIDLPVTPLGEEVIEYSPRNELVLLWISLRLSRPGLRSRCRPLWVSLFCQGQGQSATDNQHKNENPVAPHVRPPPGASWREIILSFPKSKGSFVAPAQEALSLPLV